MKKFLTVLLWIGLTASLTMLFSVIGQKNALLQAESSAVKKNETIQARLDEVKAQLNEALGAGKAMAEEKEALKKEKAALEEQLRDAAAALQAARLEAETLARSERAAGEAPENALQEGEDPRREPTAEQDAASSRLTETLAALPPQPQRTDPPTDAEPASPEAEETVIPSSGTRLPQRGEGGSIFRHLNFQDEPITEQPCLP